MEAARPLRGHDVLDHTADARIEAWAPTLAGALEEAAAGLSQLTLETATDAMPAWSDVEVPGHDLEHLAYAWLNELIAITEVEHRGITDVEVVDVRPPGDDEPKPEWRMRARVGLLPYGPGGTSALRGAKAVAMHGLRVQEAATGWTIHAVVDL